MKLKQDALLGRIQRQVDARLIAPFRLRWRHGDVGLYLARARRVTGFLSEVEGIALAQAVMGTKKSLNIVEVGSFLGQSSIIFAGCLKLKGSGKLHCIDPFDASGDSFSVPFYQRIANRRSISLLEWFKRNVSKAGVSDWIEIHQGTAQSIGPGWKEPIDILFLDGDQSPKGVRESYELFAPHLSQNSLIILHNSIDREYDEGHDGHRRLIVETIHPPEYGDIYTAGTTTFARKQV